jgi:hypothetical protein
MRNDLNTWRIVAPQTSLTDNVDDATLVLRMGIASNAIRSAQRFYWFVRDASGPAGERDRLWAFLIAIGFVHEAVQAILRPNFARIRILAAAGEADEQSLETAEHLVSGSLPLNGILRRLRNKLIFHWDDDVIREYVRGYAQGDVAWARGVGDSQGESVFSAAANALTNCVLPDELGATEYRNEERVRELVSDATPVMGTVLTVFDGAILGHIRAHHSRLESN